MLHDTGLNEALADDRLNLDQVVNKVFVRLRTWARRAQIMPHYGLMCCSLRDTAFFAKYASRRTKSSVDEYAGFPNALAVTRALNAIQDAAERHLDVHIAE
eukprot:1901712-Pleurochrysis_carterae.AAC.1